MTETASDCELTEPLIVYAFPSRSRCKRCGRINTVRTGQTGRIQWRKCTVCGWNYKVTGTIV